MTANTDSFRPDSKAAEDGVGSSHDAGHVEDIDPDAEFGGKEERLKMEKRLVRKLDARMCILIIIYILNYVSAAYNRVKSTPLTYAQD